ncbi:hypothetical protein [Paraburkholderia nemoris]|uniref:Uncharacterized protein n=1 Tax=Paraburkholderia nemoris TaxID=2793076 RepID=A0ABM8SSE3_9BURK|nr:MULTISPECIES: hypothetical protein [Paraburkholderia]MBK3815339.1 hypothetical protein [Paraburkholderia aspalathi]CAE6753298.1 hypothetical protein LMG22931_03248 [Paraburkholderia nemoris]CAE6829981.1 hypothetical protein R69776_06561 [Paraburkholderia nemoris]CAE6845846.1 hypothetical protein R75777_07298 [Paraburkholderia nemoris]
MYTYEITTTACEQLTFHSICVLEQMEDSIALHDAVGIVAIIRRDEITRLRRL